MALDRVREGETPEMLSRRLGVPICMLLRANRLNCPVWLMPGREIYVPDGDFCMQDEGVCPAQAVKMRAYDAFRWVSALPGDDLEKLAIRWHVSAWALRYVNAQAGTLMPGMRIKIPMRT